MTEQILWQNIFLAFILLWIAFGVEIIATYTVEAHAAKKSNGNTITANDIAGMTNKPAAYIYRCNQTGDSETDINNATAAFTLKQVGSAKALDSSTSYVCIVTTTMSQEDRNREAGLADVIGTIAKGTLP
jgi:hypothetical protein